MANGLITVHMSDYPAVESETNQLSPSLLQQEGGGVTDWSGLRNTGADGDSLGPLTRTTASMCGHQMSPQLPHDHPQKQGVAACGSIQC